MLFIYWLLATGYWLLHFYEQQTRLLRGAEPDTDGQRSGDQERIPAVGRQVSPGQESGGRGGWGEVQRSSRSPSGSLRPRSTQALRPRLACWRVAQRASDIGGA